jgi:sugar porter (SP) family MFS transporter
LTELAPLELRGKIGAIGQFTFTIGIVLSQIAGIKHLLGTSDEWPIIVGFFLIPVIPNTLLFIFGVESPKYLYTIKNNPTGAKNALLKLRNQNETQVETEMIHLSLEKDNLLQSSKLKWSDFLKRPALRRPLFVTIFIHITSQFSGINVVTFYSTEIFEDTGLADNAVHATVGLACVEVVMTFVCMVFIEKIGRKILLLLGVLGMIISCLLLVAFRVLGQHSLGQPKQPGIYNYLTVAAAVLFIFSFSIGPGPIPWLITSELFKSDARGKAAGLATIVNWVSSFIVILSFPFVEEAIKSYSFLMYAILLCVFGIFLFCCMPETKSLTPDKVSKMFEQDYLFIGFQKNKNALF